MAWGWSPRKVFLPTCLSVDVGNQLGFQQGTRVDQILTGSLCFLVARQLYSKRESGTVQREPDVLFFSDLVWKEGLAASLLLHSIQ